MALIEFLKNIHFQAFPVPTLSKMSQNQLNNSKVCLNIKKLHAYHAYAVNSVLVIN